MIRETNFRGKRDWKIWKNAKKLIELEKYKYEIQSLIKTMDTVKEHGCYPVNHFLCLSILKNKGFVKFNEEKFKLELTPEGSDFYLDSVRALNDIKNNEA